MKQPTKSLFLLAVGVCLASTADLIRAESWPQFRGANRDGKSTEKGLWKNIADNDPELLWTAEGVGSGYASVSIADGRVYTTGNLKDGQSVTAMDEGSGKVLWSTPISMGKPRHSYEGSRSTPTVDGEKLYVVGSGGSITCLESTTGKVVWTKDFKEWNGKMMSGWGFSESPLVDGGLVLCTPGGSDGLMVALDKQTGDEVWVTKLGDTSEDPKKLNEGAGYASIVVSNGGGVKQYVQLVGKGVVGVRASDGKLLWRYAGVGNTTANIPTVIAHENQIFCSTGYDTGSALLKLTKKGKDEVQMKEVYFLPSKTLQNKHGGMVLVDGYIYCGHGNGSGLPICVEMKSGKIAWGPQRGAGSGESSVAYADGHVVFRFQNGKVSIIKASPKKYDLVRTFEPAFQEKESWSYPAIANGKMFLREQDKIMCYRID